ncbi:MAG: urease accessory protein UreF [Betaproteobacteria bacterium]
MPTADAASRLAALLQLASPFLPVGNFSYSQGFEHAAHEGWVRSEAQARDWIQSHWTQWFAPLELRVLERCMRESTERWAAWDRWFLASRDAREAIEETQQVGSSLRRWLHSLELGEEDLGATRARLAFGWLCGYAQRPSAPVAFAACASTMGLSASEAVTAWGWSWLENQVQCAVRIIPLGQSSGQRLVLRLVPTTLAALDPGAAGPTLVHDCAAPAGFAPLAAIAGMRHERQYSRLFRS